ncbi:hypothetical protein SAMN05216464_12819 [Mucilaginibacter pineti]|uniref:Uncharacterized protein n=1 Tax=Mucilaginibacter pineti TaxID=1391627 RepID=A0A1G7NMD8_9SPHI|nr:hypothetical protein [Mucilaginibacter pineti]SDF75142.1 hypothetical protein SAMN05216464_12819 [Mucilaginibacter pineti]
MRKKILVLDDDNGILDVISYVLEDAGYMVQTLSSCELYYRKSGSFTQIWY